MGIDGIMRFLKAKVPHTIVKVPAASSFVGQRIAVDLSIIMCAVRVVTYRGTLSGVDIIASRGKVNMDSVDAITVNRVFGIIKRMVTEYGMFPVVVMDGKTPEAKRLHASKRRQADADAARAELEEVERLIAIAAAKVESGAIQGTVGMDSADILADMIGGLSIADEGDDAPSTDPDGERRPDLDELFATGGPEDYYRRYYNALCRCWYDTYDRQMLEARVLAKLEALAPDVLVLRAVGESDGLCASLFMEGRVSAIYSTDTDMIVRGCTRLITSIAGAEGEGTESRFATVVRVDNAILEELGLTRTTFTETAIMAGCDYNDGIKGISFTTAHRHILSYGTIEAYGADKGVDVACLNAGVCRDQFRYKPSPQLIDGGVLPSELLSTAEGSDRVQRRQRVERERAEADDEANEPPPIRSMDSHAPKLLNIRAEDLEALFDRPGV